MEIYVVPGFFFAIINNTTLAVLYIFVQFSVLFLRNAFLKLIVSLLVSTF